MVNVFDVTVYLNYSRCLEQLPRVAGIQAVRNEVIFRFD